MRGILNGRRPSPAMIVAVIALCVALAGSAFASVATISSLSKQEKKQVKKLAGKQANLRITKRAPKLAVASALNADHALNADKATAADKATTADKALDADKLGGLPADAYALFGSEDVHLIGQPGEPPFQNGYANFGGAFTPAGFYMDESGVVHLQGLMDPPAAPTVAFTLPEGFRPSTTHYQNIATGETSSSGVKYLGRMSITSTGELIFFAESADLVSIENISFKAGS